MTISVQGLNGGMIIEAHSNKKMFAQRKSIDKLFQMTVVAFHLSIAC